jgi:protein SCO1/2
VRTKDHDGLAATLVAAMLGRPVAIVLCVVLLASCGGAGAHTSQGTGRARTPVIAAETPSSAFRGDVLARPIRLTTAARNTTLASAFGATTLSRLASGHQVLLVYFGYTNCPDECPTTMADLGIAVGQLPRAEQSQTQVVFCTSDPERDTPAKLKSWLSHFDAGLAVPFVGVAAPVSTMDALGEALGVALKPPVREADGTIDVVHGTQVLAFVHNEASLVWLSDTAAADYQHDLTLLLER